MLNETGELRIQCTSKPVGTSRVVLFDENESVLETFDDVTADAGVIDITPNCAHLHIRSCLIYVEGSVLARAIVSHPEQLSMSSRSSRQHQIRDALGALGSNHGDISKVIATVERVIFADDSIREIEVAIRGHKQHQFRTADSENLDTLAVSTDDTPKTKKKIKVLKSGDLAYLIDVLHRRLSDGLEHNTEERDKHGRNEEEQVDQDDEDDLQTAEPTLTDLVIAKAVSSKARALTKKMVQRISVAQKDTAQRASVIIQLIAVLALLRELRHLDKMKRWRQTGQSLVENRDRRYLFDHCLEFLLGSRTGSLNVMDGITDESSEEAADMIASLLWLAWDLGLELTEQIGRMWADVEQRPALKTNGFFLRLLPELIKDSAVRQIFEESMTRTVRSTPAAQQLAYQWLDRHISFGERWANHIRTAERVDVGSYCVVPGVIDEPRIVLSAPDDIVNIWEFHKETGFSRDRVVAVRPA